MFKHDPAVHEQHPRTFWELYGTGDISRTNTNTQTYKYDSTPPFSPIHPPPLHLSSVSLSVPVDVHRVVSEAFKQVIVHIPKYRGEGLTLPYPSPAAKQTPLWLWHCTVSTSRELDRACLSPGAPAWLACQLSLQLSWFWASASLGGLGSPAEPAAGLGLLQAFCHATYFVVGWACTASCQIRSSLGALWLRVKRWLRSVRAPGDPGIQTALPWK